MKDIKPLIKDDEIVRRVAKAINDLNDARNELEEMLVECVLRLRK